MKPNESVKAMLCGLFDIKRKCKYPSGHYFDKNGAFSIGYTAGWGPDSYYEDSELVILDAVSLDASGNIQAVSKG